MKVVSYNCFEGAEHTRDSLTSCIANLSPDVLQLQEINGWDEGSPTPLHQLARNGNFITKIFGNSNTRFKLGTLARQRALSSGVITEGFWHSAIHTELPFKEESLHLWNVHLNPWLEDNRLPEIEAIIDRIDLASYALVTGDFNSLAEADNYDEEHLLAEFRARKLKKFGEDALRFDVINRVKRAGLTDIGSLYSWQNTVPTPANADSAHAAALRLDYAFATPQLAACVKNYRVVKNSLSDQASDHYPIEIIIDDRADDDLKEKKGKKK